MNGFSTEEDSHDGPPAPPFYGQSCCLIEDGERCGRSAGNASFSKRIQKSISQKKLNWTSTRVFDISTSVTFTRISFRVFATRGRGRPAMMEGSPQIMMWRCPRWTFSSCKWTRWDATSDTTSCRPGPASIRPSWQRRWAVTSGIFRWMRRRRWPTLFTWWRAARAAWTRKGTVANRWTKLPPQPSQRQLQPPQQQL